MARKERSQGPGAGRVPVKVVGPKYGFLLRLADNQHGRQDARGVEDCRVEDLPWSRRLAATAGETNRVQLATAQDHAQAAVVRLRAVSSSLGELDRRLAAAEARKKNLPVPDLSVRGGAEAHLTADAVAVRRTREAAQRAAIVQAEIDRLRVQREEAVDEGARLEAQLIELFDLTVALSYRTTEFYNRRLATYTRQIHRRKRTTAAVPQMEPPSWALHPCPWLPEVSPESAAAEVRNGGHPK